MILLASELKSTTQGTILLCILTVLSLTYIPCRPAMDHHFIPAMDQYCRLAMDQHCRLAMDQHCRAAMDHQSSPAMDHQCSPAMDHPCRPAMYQHCRPAMYQHCRLQIFFYSLIKSLISAGIQQYQNSIRCTPNKQPANHVFMSRDYTLGHVCQQFFRLMSLRWRIFIG